MPINNSPNKYFRPLAKAGLIAKGIVYCLMGIIALMAAFNMGGSSTRDTNKSGVLELIRQQIGGQILLAAVALGLICYGIWRAIQAFADTEEKGKKAKGIFIRARYLFSGLVYSSLAWAAIKMLIAGKHTSGSDSNENLTQTLLNKPFGQWLVGIVAVIVAGIGLYQCYFGLSEKFKKHVQKSVSEMHRKIVTATGTVGYVARGIVWLIIGVLFTRAALNSQSSEAGSTSDAFSFLSKSSYGTYLIAAVGIGLVFYGAFNFVRARFEKFEV